MSKKILITGATGYIGKNIAAKLINRGDSVIVVTRNIKAAENILGSSIEAVAWTDKNNLIRALESSHAVINLSGASVMGKRWNDDYKRLILKSRTDSTKSLIDCMKKVLDKPEVFISASAIGFYKRSESEVYDEESEPGNSFLSVVTREWEKEAEKAAELGIRETRIRIGIVLDKSGGALNKMLVPFNFFAGGPLGSGRQWFSWVHLDDVVNLFIRAVDDNSFAGVFNAVSPGAVTMLEFAKSLGRAMHRPAIFKVPQLILKIVLGESSIEVLTGANIFPKRTIETGYKFKFENIDYALDNIINK